MSEKNRHSRNTVVAGQSVGGQFAASTKTEADGSALEPVTTELPQLSALQIEKIMDGDDMDTNAWGEDDADTSMSVYNIVREHVQAKTDYERDLVFVGHDDQLSNTQIDSYLSGNFSKLYAIEDNFHEDKCDRSEEIAVELLEELGIEDPRECNPGLVEELGEVVRDYDTSDPITQLANNTHPQLLRAPLGQQEFSQGEFQRNWVGSNEYGFTSDELYNGGDDRSADARTAYITAFLGEAGVDVSSLTSEDQAQIRGLATEGPYYWHEGVTLDAIWHGNVTEAAVPGEDGSRTMRLGGAPAHSRENQAGKAHIVLLDPVNGSGYDASLTVPVTVSVDGNRPAKLDSGGSSYGYGWDDTAGVHKPAYGVVVRDVSDTRYDDQRYGRGPDGRLTKLGQFSAQEDIRSELAGQKRALRALKQQYRGKDIPDEVGESWNAIHDRVSELESAQHQVAINRGYVAEGSTEALAMSNID